METSKNGGSAEELTIDQIMERLQRLSRLHTVLKTRANFPSGGSKWYVHIGFVYCFCSIEGFDGSTPEEAIRNTWATVTSTKHPLICMRYFCKPDEKIPGNGPQVWVKWDSEKDDWADTPPQKDYASYASEIRPYERHRWMERVS